MPDIEEKIRTHIAETILFSPVGYPYANDASFLENNVIDSMNIMELVIFLEETFNIQIADHEILPENFDSVTQMADFVRSKLAVAW